VIGLLQLLAAGYATFLASLIAYTAWMLTHPPRKTYAWAVARGRPGDPSELPGRGREFAVWTFASRGLTFEVWDVAGDAPEGPTVILTHGWADSRLGGLARAPMLAMGASRLILWDLRGHGGAPGWCRLGTAEVEDLVELVGVVKGKESGEHYPCRATGNGTGGGQEHYPCRATGSGTGGIVLYGWSLGAGVSIAAAARGIGVAGVIAEAPYRRVETPARNVMRGFRLPHALNLPPAMWGLGVLFGAGAAWREFDRALHAGRLACPLLVLHGEHDAVCPVEDARAIAAAASKADLVIVAGAGHNNLWTDPASAEVCGRVALAFLGRAEVARPTGTLSA
jgi:pimeloyl-ACP methyl ester carboxylesterase